METQKYRHMISVVVPVYNAQEYLAVMIESLLNQSYAKWELILVENGSRDGSFEICTMYEKKGKIRTGLSRCFQGKCQDAAHGTLR